MDGEEEEGWHIFSYFMHLPMIGSFAHSFFITPQKNLWNMSCIPYLVIWRKSVVVRKVRSKKLSCLLKFLQWWDCRAKSWSQDSKAQSLIVCHELNRTWFQNFSMSFALEHSWMKSALPPSQQGGLGRSPNDSLWPHELYSPWKSPGWNTGVGSCSLLQGIFPTQGLNPGLPHCRQILYQLSHQGSPRILEWVAYPFSSGSLRLGSPSLQEDSLPAELLGKPRNPNNYTVNLIDSRKHHSFLHLFYYAQIHQCSLSQTLLLTLRLERAVGWMVGSSSMFV